ncbi:glycosyltransferase family 9 protein [Chryseobacterium caseinilyticum]|uniref:Glycosyltransferase family 9 protein n=1 Tax=Chryseobacterium caseinilyticum TaxID=2771428 RepID=A0ABR8ZD25_9FLAO|nr:glycosyltransferase family 9 protein [Chryseobacterium caseinilyticum]MBD8083192.1 glycosyltransferase family 9 protein [Chryseobacterium caseinilyticum]
MKVSKKVNTARRSLMRGLTKNVGKSHAGGIVKRNIPIKKILISRPNHRLGNLLLLSPLVQEVIDTFPEAKIDLFVKGGITPIIYKNYKNIDRIIQLPKKPFSSLFQYIKGWATLKSRKYDLVINASYGSSSGKLSTSMARSEYKVFGDTDEKLQSEFSDYRHAAKNSIYSLRDFLSQLDIDRSGSKIPDLDIKLSEAEIEEGKEKLNNLVKNDRKSICLFTNATGAKCYSEEWWNAFYEKLETAFPNYNIVELLPVENISKINFSAPSFYSKDIREMGGFITNCEVFIAADNGVMHLASAVNTPTVGLFMVTEEEVYKPYNEASFAVNTNEHSTDEIINHLKNIL